MESVKPSNAETIWFTDNGARRFQTMVRMSGWENYVFEQNGQNAIVSVVRSHCQDDLDEIEYELKKEAEALAQRRDDYNDNRSHLRLQRSLLNMPQKNTTWITRPFITDKPSCNSELANP